MPDPAGLTVWDLGCGLGKFSAAFARMRAKSILASDISLPPDPPSHAEITYVRGDFDAADAAISLQKVDFVFMHLMSEHVTHLKDFLGGLHRRLRPGSDLLLHHDNYFQPVGHHDHAFLRLNEATWEVDASGPACWQSPRKCAASAERRAILLKEWSNLWSEASEATKDPANCDGCNFYRRSRPWAHLLYGNELQRTFPEAFFRKYLNRLSPAQVEWDAQDAGFKVLDSRRSWIMSKPPEHLVLEHGRHALLTFALTLRLRRT